MDSLPEKQASSAGTCQQASHEAQSNLANDAECQSEVVEKDPNYQGTINLEKPTPDSSGLPESVLTQDRVIAVSSAALVKWSRSKRVVRALPKPVRDAVVDMSVWRRLNVKQKQRLRMRWNRMKETPEDRVVRLHRNRERARERRANENAEERAERLVKQRNRTKFRREHEEDAKRAHCVLQQRYPARKRRSGETHQSETEDGVQVGEAGSFEFSPSHI